MTEIQTVTEQAGGGETEPSSQDTSTDVFSETPSENETETVTDSLGEPAGETPTVLVGQTARDDGVAFTVNKVDVVNSVEQDFDAPYRAPKNAKLVLVTVTFKNNTKQPLDPFCGGNGAVLLDEQDRNFEPLSEQISIPGNNICGDEAQPGFKRTDKLLFKMPKGADPAAVALWNGAAPDDYSGSTYVVFLVL